MPRSRYDSITRRRIKVPSKVVTPCQEVRHELTYWTTTTPILPQKLDFGRRVYPAPPVYPPHIKQPIHSPTLHTMPGDPLDPVPPETQSGSTPRKRTSKACENCRLRRVKCTGDIPCTACLESSITESCHVRVKARPKRYVHGYRSANDRLLSARVKKDIPDGRQVGRFEDSLAFLDDVMPLEVNRAGPSTTRRIPTHPLSQLEEDLAIWCNQHGQSQYQRETGKG